MASKGSATASQKKLNLIVSDEKTPAVKLQPGMKLDVVSVSLVQPTLKAARARAARLCGGTDTCLALVEVGSKA